MKVIRKSLCVFIHYSQQAYLPRYVSIYVNELSNYFDRVILVTNLNVPNPDLLNLRQNNNYHIQSHFIVFNQKAIEQLPAFFNALQIQELYEEKNVAKLRQMVINKWEIGLSQFFINEGLSNGSYIDSRSYSYLHLSGKLANIGHKLYPELIQSGFPLIKKKIITNGNWKDIFRSGTHWKNMIRQYGNQNWEIEALIEELIQIKNESENQSLNKMKNKLWNGYDFLQKTDIA